MRNPALSLLVWLALAAGAPADSLVAAHTIRSRSIVSPADVRMVQDALPGALSHPDQAIGMEARVVLYAGRAVRPEDLVAPAMIERNEIVPLVFNHGGLAISTEGRSLDRAAIGERVRVMNLQSRSTVIGTVDETGRVIVGPREIDFTRTEKRQ